MLSQRYQTKTATLICALPSDKIREVAREIEIFIREALGLPMPHSSDEEESNSEMFGGAPSAIPDREEMEADRLLAETAISGGSDRLPESEQESDPE